MIFLVNLRPYRLSAGVWMFCTSCRRSLFSRRSELCIPCSAVATLQEEFRRVWGDESLRFLAGDVAVSAARHVRGLRVASEKTARLKDLGVTPKSAATKPPASQQRSPSPARKPPPEVKREASPSRRRGRSPSRVREDQRVAPRSSVGTEERETPAKSAPAAPFSPSSYTGTVSEAEKRKIEDKREAADRRRSPCQSARQKRSVRGSSRRQRRSRSRKDTRVRTDLPPVPFDFNDPAFKERSKAEYLKDLAEQEKRKISLSEGPGGRKDSLLPEALLKVPGESQEREVRSKAKRRQK